MSAEEKPLCTSMGLPTAARLALILRKLHCGRFIHEGRGFNPSLTELRIEEKFRKGIKGQNSFQNMFWKFAGV